LSHIVRRWLWSHWMGEPRKPRRSRWNFGSNSSRCWYFTAFRSWQVSVGHFVFHGHSIANLQVRTQKQFRQDVPLHILTETVVEWIVAQVVAVWTRYALFSHKINLLEKFTTLVEALWKNNGRGYEHGINCFSYPRDLLTMLQKTATLYHFWLCFFQRKPLWGE